MLHLTGGLATFALFTAACGDDEESGDNNPMTPAPGEMPPEVSAVFDRWLMVRDAARKSPDHTRGRADQVVASRDANLIHRFVRDEIGLLVPHGTLDRAEVGVRWGIEGVLRGGVGTFRERAELLASLYVRAGFTAKVRLGVLPRPVANDVLYRRIEQEFAPPIDEATMRALWKSLGQEVPTPKRFDPDGVDSKKLASALLPLLPNARATVLVPPTLNLVPMVSVTVEGKEKLAYPYGDLELVDPTPGLVTTDAPAANPPTSVRIAYSMTTIAGDVPLVDMVLGADQVVGKQVKLCSPPPVDPLTALFMRSADVHLFVPTLAITSPSLDGNAVASSLKSGRALSDRGDLVVEDATGLYVDGVAASPAGPGSDGASVAAVTVVANPAAFPTIELLVSATDGAGKPVPTLAASAMRVTEDGVDRNFLVVANAAPKPRVLVVYDTSVSIPPAFFESAGRTSFGSSIAQALQDRIPGVELQVVGTVLDKPAVDKWSKPTPAEFGAAVSALAGNGSFVWTGARNAELASPAVVILLTDFLADEKLDPNLAGIKASLPSGAPIVCVAVGTTDAQVQAEIAALTGGVALALDTPSNVGALADAVTALFAKRVAAPYRLSYRAPAEGAATRKVTVAIPKSTAKGETSYVVPAVDKHLPAGGILGLSLVIQIGDDLPIKRTLAGLDATEAAEGVALSAAAAAEIRETLLGTTAVSFEGGAPSTGTWVDDYLTGRLSTRALHEALTAKDVTRFHAALEAGFSLLPEALDALHVPPSFGAPGEPVVMERGLRAVLYKFTRRLGATDVYRSDILQSTKLESTASTAEAAFKQTLEASCRLMLGEAGVFTKSTVAALKQVPLVRVAAGSADVSMFPEATRARWKKLLLQYPDFDRLVPSAGAPIAMWAIDPATGSAFSVGADGAGIGEQDVPDQAQDPNMLDKLYDTLGLLGGGPYAIMGKHCARIFIRAGNEFVPGYVGPPVNGNDAICDFAKDLAKDLALGGLGKVGNKLASAADTSREWAKWKDPIPNLPGC
jgi:hypothetical protein